MADFSKMGVEPTLAAQYSHLVGRLLLYSTLAVDGLTVDQLSDTHGGRANAIGFDVWHVVRTTDNIIHFVFEREQPVWLTGGFHERWGLPKVDQGTGMNPGEAYAQKYPEPEEFKRYIRAVEEAVVPRIAAMDAAYLATVQFIRPWGEIPHMEAIGHGLIGHGNGHLGRACLARSLLGLKGLPY
ncbi:MAG TPA: DinB family protein [Dehalococcoidia bacterium]|nr:DinB family protein [Dehalococcoidia bacterium]